MKDAVCVNRQFLLMAREAAKQSAGEVLTGLPTSVLGKIRGLDLEQLEVLASSANLSLITFRITAADIDRILTANQAQRPAAVVAATVKN